MARQGDTRKPRLWNATGLRTCAESGLRPRPRPDEGAEHMKVPPPPMVILGSVATKEHDPGGPLGARLKAAWLEYSKVRAQLQHRYTPLAMRVKLMDSVLLIPTILWGLETARLPKTQKRRINAFQRQVMARMLLIAHRASETLEDFLRRRERVVTASLKNHRRGIWGHIQQYRFITFHGHVARLQPTYHMSTQALMWRGSRWWQAYRHTLPPRTGGRIGRRAAAGSRPMLNEIPLIDAFAMLQRSSLWSRS